MTLENLAESTDSGNLFSISSTGITFLTSYNGEALSLERGRLLTRFVGQADFLVGSRCFPFPKDPLSLKLMTPTSPDSHGVITT